MPLPVAHRARPPHIPPTRPVAEVVRTRPRAMPHAHLEAWIERIDDPEAPHEVIAIDVFDEVARDEVRAALHAASPGSGLLVLLGVSPDGDEKGWLDAEIELTVDRVAGDAEAEGGRWRLDLVVFDPADPEDAEPVAPPVLMEDDDDDDLDDEDDLDEDEDDDEDAEDDDMDDEVEEVPDHDEDEEDDDEVVGRAALITLRRIGGAR